MQQIEKWGSPAGNWRLEACHQFCSRAVDSHQLKTPLRSTRFPLELPIEMFLQPTRADMANSRIPSYYSLPTWTELLPSQTPGPLGHLDQGDPNHTTRLGDTPGPLGVNDWGDPCLPWAHTTFPSNLGGICRAKDGTALAMKTGASASQLETKAASIPLRQAQMMALEISTTFEGGKPMNYQALSGDFDKQATSFGLIQWNFGQNTLGPLLKKMLAANEDAFARCFSKDADYATLKKALDHNDQTGQVNWAKTLQTKHYKAWSEAFRNLGSVEQFNRIQVDEALARYYPLAVEAIGDLRHLNEELMRAVEFRSYAALYDLCVQQNGLDKAIDQIKKRIKAEKPKNQLELLTIAVQERAKKAASVWVGDCMTRRMGILTGDTYEHKVPSVKKGKKHVQIIKRENPQYRLVVQFGTAEVQGL